MLRLRSVRRGGSCGVRRKVPISPPEREAAAEGLDRHLPPPCGHDPAQLAELVPAPLAEDPALSDVLPALAPPREPRRRSLRSIVGGEKGKAVMTENDAGIEHHLRHAEMYLAAAIEHLRLALELREQKEENGDRVVVRNGATGLLGPRAHG